MALFSLSAFACSSSSGNDHAAAGANGALGGTNAGGSSGATDGGSVHTGGGGAAALGGASGSAGAGGPGCNGSLAGVFRDPKTIMTAPIGDGIGNFALSEDQRELFFVHRVGSAVAGQWNYRRSLRTSPSGIFPMGTVVPELDAACAGSGERGLDLSLDGLRTYLHCQSTDSSAFGLVYLAERATNNGSFLLSSGNFGTTGYGIGLSADELGLYTGDDQSIPSLTQSPQFYTRPNRTSPFADPQPILGLEETGLVAPFVTSDGLTLIASQRGVLVAAHRQSTSAAFGPLETLFTPEDADTWHSSPVPSRDCSSVYYLEIKTRTVDVDPMVFRVASR